MLNRLSVTALPLTGLRRIERERLGDTRGFFARLFCAEELKPVGWNWPVAQVNHSYTARRGTVRGLHFQYPPHADMKLVTCIRGEIWDVAVDIRAGSTTFLSWHAELLSADNCRALLIPQGYAHGFQAQSDDAELLYCHSASYSAAAEGGLHPRDPKLAISWPIHISEMSPRDSQHPMLNGRFAGIAL